MFKLIGSVGILYGFAKGIWEWNKRQRIGQERLKELVYFLSRMEQAIEREQIPMPVFLQIYSSRDVVMKKTIEKLHCTLIRQEAKGMEEAWRSVFLDMQREWDLSPASWEMILDCARAFSHTHRKELVEFLKKERDYLEQQKQKEYVEYQQKKKVFLPVGMLSGAMLVLLFL